MTAYLEHSIWPDERPYYVSAPKRAFHLSPLALSFGIFGIISVTSLTYAAHQLDRVTTPHELAPAELSADAQPGALALGQALPLDSARAPAFIGGYVAPLNPEMVDSGMPMTAQVAYDPAFDQAQTQPVTIDGPQPIAAPDEPSTLLAGNKQTGPYGDPYAGTSAGQ